MYLSKFKHDTIFWRCHSLSPLITVATYGYCHNPGRLNLMRAEMCIVMTRQRYLLSILEYWRGKFKQSKPSKRNLRFIPQPQLYSFPSAPFPSSVILLSAPSSRALFCSCERKMTAAIRSAATYGHFALQMRLRDRESALLYTEGSTQLPNSRWTNTVAVRGKEEDVALGNT